MARSGKKSRRVPWKRLVHVRAFATIEFADSPHYASFTVNERFIRTLRRLQKLCRKHKLREVRITDYPDRWGPSDDEDEMNLRGDELVVAGTLFWFSARPNHCDYYIETLCQSVDEFCHMTRSADPLFIEVDPDDVEEETEADIVEMHE